MTWFSGLTGADYATGVQGLFPRGLAWTRATGSTMAALFQGIADCLFTYHQSLVLWLETESFPADAVQCLPDFEADYGLPDSCTPANPTMVQRRAALMAKIAASPGGQSEAYFISVAAALGYPITITTWDTFVPGPRAALGPGAALVSQPWRLAWRVNAPTITVQRFQVGVSALLEPLWTIGNTQLQCRLSKLQPAYGVLWFNYS